jgi:hypothetical protein
MAASAPPVSSPALDILRRVLQVLRLTAVVALGLVTALGAVTNPQTSLLLGAGLAALGWAPVRMLARSPEPDLPPLPHPAVPATWMAVLPAGVAGMATIGLGSLGLVGAILGVASVLGWWASSCVDPAPPPAGRDTRPGPADGSLHDLLRTLPVEILLEEWRDTTGKVVPGGGDTEECTRLRGLLIDELHRRDPVGAGRWLAEAPEAPPDGYIQETRDRAP